MNIKVNVFLSIFLMSAILTYAQKSKIASYYDYQNECLEDKLDGSYIVQGWGKGSTKKEAIDQAKRNVLNDILLNGISKGCKLLPLIIELNAETKYKEYIYSFFNSDYKKFIEIEKSSKTLKKSIKQTTYGVKLKVNRQSLRKKLIQDNILK